MAGKINLTDELKKYFGFNKFKGNQEAIIQNLLDGKDTFVLMPTGGGKSLCYQLPSLLMEGTAIVISPLIALMKNQVDAMRNFSEEDGIAHFINSSLNKGAIDQVRSDILAGKTKLLYVAPESLTKEENVDFLRSVKISFYAVDEAHCISEWGHDFRPEYRRIRPIINEIGKAPLIALTATATPKVQHDIQKNLGMVDAQVFKSSFNRPNLYYEVRAKTNNIDKDIIKFIKNNSEKSGIIYCLSRKKVEELAEILQANGINARPYHAGMDSMTRTKNQDDFLMEKVEVIVATIAFGMGIDKPDVRFVVHYNMPKNMESYYQEAGRAGRDGEPAECILYYAPIDNRTNRFLIENGEENEELDAITKQIVMERDWERLRQMTFYCYTKECLRHYILNYFGEQTSGYCGNCLNCLTEFETVDATMEAKAIIQCIRDCYRDFGLSTIVDILKGSKSQKVLSRHLDENSQYGALASESIARIRQIINEMLVYGYLEMTDDEYPVLSVADITKIDDNWNFEIKIPKEVEKEKEERKIQTKKRKKAGAVAALAEEDTELFEALRVLRRMIASEQKIPPYMVFSDKTLVHMSTMKPSNDEEMLEVNGVGEHKLQKYGECFLNEIQKYK